MHYVPAWVRSAVIGAVLLTGGCAWMRPAPTPILPADELYQVGENDLEKRSYDKARESFMKIVERHPNSSYAPRARFLVGESYYRQAEFEKAIKEFETFLSFYPSHQIADLVQYRLAMAYYDQMKPIEQDQGLTNKALDQFKKLVKDYPESRYAGDALAKIDICRGRLAQKELWIAAWYYNQGNPTAGKQRLEKILRDYPRSLVVPETMWLLAEAKVHEGKIDEARDLLQKLSGEYSYSEFGRRAAQRLRDLAPAAAIRNER